MLMNWMGLKTVPDAANQLNEDNGFPVIQPCPSPTVSSDTNKNNREMLERLYAGLDSFETSLGYVFKNKLLLIEALTHASYFPNRLTDCYQRLEFLGDAVLGNLSFMYKPNCHCLMVIFYVLICRLFSHAIPFRQSTTIHSCWAYGSSFCYGQQFDICCNRRPEQLSSIFEASISSAQRHGRWICSSSRG